MNRTKATLLGIAAILLWSSTIAVGRSVSEKIGAFTAAGCIYMLGGILTLLVSYLRNRRVPRISDYPPNYFYLCGFLFTLNLATIYKAVWLASDRSQMLEIALINYLWPVLTVLFSVVILKYRAAVSLYLGVLLTVFGILLVTTQGRDFSLSGFLANIEQNPAPYLLALVAAVSWGIYSNISKLWGPKEGGGGVGLFMLTASIVLFTLRIFSQEQSIWSMPTVLEVLFMSVVSTLGYLFWDIGIREGNFKIVSISSYFTPLLSTLISCAYLGVTASNQLWFGCIAVVVGAYLSKIGVKEASA